MFLGTYEPNLLDASRLALPKKIREQLGGSHIVLTVGFENCIFGFAEKIWDQVTAQELSRPLFSDREGRDLRRKMCAEAINVQLDSQGRFVVPDRMLSLASIRDHVVVIGAGDHFEIWSKEGWEAYRQEMVKS
jgi:MraZ protein